VLSGFDRIVFRGYLRSISRRMTANIKLVGAPLSVVRVRSVVSRTIAGEPWGDEDELEELYPDLVERFR
jgi:hypothetical protein